MNAKPEVVVDTNVLVVAEGRANHASVDCQISCVRRLHDVRSSEVTLLDADGYILREYRRNVSLKGQPGVGSAFLKFVHDHQGDPSHCRRVEVKALNDTGMESAGFPDTLKGLDPSDCKFVAVALEAASSPPILNAVDLDWSEHRDALLSVGIRVEELCPVSPKKKQRRRAKK